MLVVFLALVVGPIVAGKYLPAFKIPGGLALQQPINQNNNDTTTGVTGEALNGLNPTATA